MVSWLALYHISDRKRLLHRCERMLTNGGYFYAVDLFGRQPFKDKELKELSRELYANYLPDYRAYHADFSEVGFTSLAFADLSDDWTDFTRSRLTAYRKNKFRPLRVHGEEVVTSMESFYETVGAVF